MKPLSLAFLNYNYTSKRTLPNPLTPPVNLTYDRIQAATPNVLPDNSPLISGDESLEAVIAYSISPICSGTIPVSAPILNGNTQINFANVNQGTTCSYSIPNLPPYLKLYNPPSPTNPNFLRPNPQLSISVLGSTQNAMSNTVSWIVSLQNASTDVAELAYIRLNNSPHIQFTMVESCQNNNCSGTLNQISISSNGYYNLGNIKNDGAHFYKITGTFNPCVIPYDANFEEIIPFEWGYFCSLSNLNAAPPTPCITNVAELRVKQARAELNNYTTGINNPTSYNSCGNYNFTSSVQSSNNGEVYDFDFEIILFPFMVLQSNWSVEIIQNNITTATYTNSNNPHNLSFIQISGTNNWAMDLSALNNELGASASNGLSLGNRINVTYGVELKCGYTGQYPSTLFNGISFCGESLSTNYPTYGWTYNTDGCNPACNNPCAHAPYGTPVINGNPGHSCVGSCYILTSPQLPCATLYNWTELNNINNPSLTFVTFTEFGNPTNTGRAITTTSNQVLYVFNNFHLQLFLVTESI
ncbi:MAG: hypothetical protein IPJ26_17385 [Bacteroidetes bacterium]|nr:hypothetical protein [Bacteroidota bacterium]